MITEANVMLPIKNNTDKKKSKKQRFDKYDQRKKRRCKKGSRRGKSGFCVKKTGSLGTVSSFTSFSTDFPKMVRSKSHTISKKRVPKNPGPCYNLPKYPCQNKEGCSFAQGSTRAYCRSNTRKKRS